MNILQTNKISKLTFRNSNNISAVSYNRASIVDDKKQNNDKRNIAIASTIAAAIIAATLLVKGKKVSSIKSKDGSVLLNSRQVGIFTEQVKKFASDIDYRKSIARAVGIKESNNVALRPIVGPQEYKGILSEFSSSAEHYTAGDKLITDVQDGYDLLGKRNKSFRANMHIHTTHSDGRMGVKELLDQSAQYADEVADAIKGNSSAKASHAPFTIAITDHDTVEGCKEATQIISKDPWKYRNLRVIMGCELSVETKDVGHGLTRPVENHMLLHGINPFDEKLNKFLDAKKAARLKLADSIIARAKSVIEKVSPNTASKLSREDARGLYPSLDKSHTHINLPTKDYLQFRTIFTECFEGNKWVQDKLGIKGVQADAIKFTTPKDEYFEDIGKEFKSGYWERYHKALVKYASNILGKGEDEVAAKMPVSQELQKAFKEVE